MQIKVITIHKSATYEDAARLLYEKEISGAPVIDDAGNLVGIISEKDLFKVLYPFYHSFHDNPELYTDFEEREKKIQEIKGHIIEKIMSTKIISVGPETPIMKVGGIMLAKGIHRLPVVEDGKLIGLVSRGQIFKKILEKYLDFDESPPRQEAQR